MVYSISLCLQKELEKIRMEQESAVGKQNLQDESLRLHTTYSDLEVTQLKAEIEVGFLLFSTFFQQVRLP